MGEEELNKVEYITYTLAIPKYKIVDYKFAQSNDYLQTELIHQLQQENKQLQEIIEEVRELRNQFIEENELFCFENNCLINLMNKLLQILDKAKENK